MGVTLRACREEADEEAVHGNPEAYGHRRHGPAAGTGPPARGSRDGRKKCVLASGQRPKKGITVRLDECLQAMCVCVGAAICL